MRLKSLCGLLLLILGHFFRLPGLTQDMTAVVVTFGVTLFLWISVDVIWPSLLCLISLILIKPLGAKVILANSFGNEIFVFLLFTFICTYALTTTTLIKRLALGFVTSKIAQKGLWQLQAMFLAAVFICGLVISPTVLFFMFYPLFEEICALLGLKKGQKPAAYFLLGLVLVVNLTAGITPIAHVFPVLALSAYANYSHETINYLHYTLMALPLGVLLFGVILGLLKLAVAKTQLTFTGLKRNDFAKMPPIQVNEILILVVLGFVLGLWILPDILIKVFPIFSNLKALGNAFAPLVGCCLLTLIKVNKQPLLNFNQALAKGVSWPSLLMCATTLALGASLTSSQIGLIKWLTNTLSPIAQNLPSLGLIIFFVAWACLESNLSSHIVTAQVVASLAVPIVATTISLPAALVVASLIGIGASLGSAAPPAMPFVAVACSSGWLTTKTMLKQGIIYTGLALIILVVLGYPLGLLILGN